MTNMLPINASRLQRDLDNSIGPRQALLDSTNQIPGIKYDPPDELLSWLIWEYGLEQLLPYLDDPRLAIQEGVQWQRIKGTPKSLSMALGWLALDDVTIEPETPGEHFHEYQLDSGHIVAGELLEKLRIVSRYSAPLRSRLSRIYHGYDIRRLKLDDSDYGALLSDYSGVDKDGVVLSFGREQQSHVTLNEIDAKLYQNSHKVAYTKDIHWPNLDDQPIGGDSLKSFRSNHRSQAAKIQKTSWLGYWDDRNWYGSDFPSISLKAIRIYIREHQTSSIIPAPQIQLNTNISLTHTLAYNGVQSYQNRTTAHLLGLAAEQQLVTQQANSYRHDIRHQHTTPHGSIWLDNWDERKWHYSTGFTIGIANNTLGTHYHSASTTWDSISELAHIQARAIDSQSAEQIDHQRVRLWPLSPTDTNNNQASDSHRSTNRHRGIYCFEQQWSSQWDERQWHKTTTIVIGSASSPLTTNYYHASTFWQTNSESGLIQTRASDHSHITEIDNQLVKQHQAIDLSNALETKQSDSYRSNYHGNNIHGLTQQWLGLWDDRQWQNSHHALISSRHQLLTDRDHQQLVQLNEPISGSGYLAKNSQLANLGQIQSPSMRVRITPNHQNATPLLTGLSIEHVRLSINSLRLDATSALWFGYWDTRLWQAPQDLNIGHINHTQETTNTP